MAAEREDRFQSATVLAEAVRAYLDRRVVPDYRLTFWQKLLQTLGIVAAFVAAMPLIGLGGPINPLNMMGVSALVLILSLAACYQALVVSPGLSVVRGPRARTRSPARAAGSLALQDGVMLAALWSVVFDALLLSAIFFLGLWPADTARVGPVVATALLMLLYAFPLILVMQLDHARNAREFALFSFVAPGRWTHVGKLTSLSVLALSAQISVTVLAFLSPGNAGTAYAHAPAVAVSRALMMGGISLVASLGYFRIVFTFREFGAAIVHLLIHTTGGVVSPENRRHAAAVLLFGLETYLLWTLALGTLPTIQLFGEFAIRDYVPVCIGIDASSLLALVFYLLGQRIVIRRLSTDEGRVEEEQQVALSVAQTNRALYGDYWTRTERGRWAKGSSIALAGLSITFGVWYGRRLAAVVVRAAARAGPRGPHRRLRDSAAAPVRRVIRKSDPVTLPVTPRKHARSTWRSTTSASTTSTGGGTRRRRWCSYRMKLHGPKGGPIRLHQSSHSGRWSSSTAGRSEARPRSQETSRRARASFSSRRE